MDSSDIFKVLVQGNPYEVAAGYRIEKTNHSVISQFNATPAEGFTDPVFVVGAVNIDRAVV